MYDFFYEYFDYAFSREPSKVSGRERSNKKNESFIESIPPTISSTSFATNIYTKVKSWLPMCDTMCTTEPMWFSQPPITLKWFPSQQIIIILKGVPQDDKPLIYSP